MDDKSSVKVLVGETCWRSCVWWLDLMPDQPCKFGQNDQARWQDQICSHMFLQNKHSISYHIISYHIISYHIISYHIYAYPMHICRWVSWFLDIVVVLRSNKLLLRIHEIRGSVGPGGHLILFQFAAGGGKQFDWKFHLFLGVFRSKDPRVFCWNHQGREQKLPLQLGVSKF